MSIPLNDESVSEPASADEFIREQLDTRLQLIGEKFSADALCLVGSIYPTLDDYIRNVIDHLRQKAREMNRLIVLLTTGGGQIETVQRIVETLRFHYQWVGFVIPNYAFSAGTVLAMSGDDIYMNYYSRLGPIDPQVRNAKGRWVPALGYLIQWERLRAKAEAGTLTLVEAQLMIGGFDQAELYQYEQARELSVTLLKEWLVNYKFKNWNVTRSRGKSVTNRMKRLRAEKIARMLNDTDRWHSHGYGISMELLRRDLNLQIEDFDTDQERSKAIRQYDSLLSDYLTKLGAQGALHTVHQFLPF